MVDTKAINQPINLAMLIRLTMDDVQYHPETHRIVPTGDQMADLRELFAQFHDPKGVIDFVAPFYGATPEEKERAIALAKAMNEAAIESNTKEPVVE